MKLKNIKFTLLALLFVSIQSPSLAAETPGNIKTEGPIEITSDALEVYQKENKAIFTGHVLAVQGDVKLKSEKMTVLYKNSGAKEGKKAGNAASDMGEKNSIDKILVEKKVFLTTPDETASGAHGMYDVSDRKIYLNDNVVLTRDQNVLKGDKLVYDFVSGRSELKSPAAAKSGQRVRALFITDDKNKASKPKPDTDPAKKKDIKK